MSRKPKRREPKPQPGKRPKGAPPLQKVFITEDPNAEISNYGRSFKVPVVTDLDGKLVIDAIDANLVAAGWQTFFPQTRPIATDVTINGCANVTFRMSAINKYGEHYGNYGSIFRYRSKSCPVLDSIF